jgi:hypothetical protein
MPGVQSLALPEELRPNWNFHLSGGCMIPDESNEYREELHILNTLVLAVLS